MNDRIASVAWYPGEDDRFEFVCECADDLCLERILLTLAEFTRFRQGGLVLACGHTA